MAKYHYEKWTIKWDETQWDGERLSLLETVKVIKINFDGSGTTESPASTLNVGDCFCRSTSWPDISNGTPTKFFNYVVSTSTFSVKYLTFAEERTLESLLATCRAKETKIADIFDSAGAYPLNGVHTDGFWYVRGEPVVAQVDVKTAAGTLAKHELHMVGADGSIVPIQELQVVEEVGGVKKLQPIGE